MSLTSMEIDSIAQHVKASLTSADAEASGLLDQFCKNWPTIRQGLTLLQQLLALVPAVGAMANTTINLVIGIGDAVQKAMCPGQAGAG